MGSMSTRSNSAIYVRNSKNVSTLLGKLKFRFARKAIICKELSVAQTSDILLPIIKFANVVIPSVLDNRTTFVVLIAATCLAAFSFGY